MKVSINDNWTDVCNKALLKLGLPLITSVTSDKGEEARKCRMLLPEAIGVCSEYANWSFLKREARLSKKAYSVPEGSNQSYSYCYEMPSDMVRLISAKVGCFKYEKFGNEIRTDSSTCIVKYVALPDAPETLPFYFKVAIECYLAYLLAVDSTVKALMASDFNSSIMTAKANDSSDLRSGGNAFWTEEIGS